MAVSPHLMTQERCGGALDFLSVVSQYRVATKRGEDVGHVKGSLYYHTPSAEPANHIEVEVRLQDHHQLAHQADFQMRLIVVYRDGGEPFANRVSRLPNFVPGASGLQYLAAVPDGAVGCALLGLQCPNRHCGLIDSIVGPALSLSQGHLLDDTPEPRSRIRQDGAHVPIEFEWRLPWRVEGNNFEAISFTLQDPPLDLREVVEPAGAESRHGNQRVRSKLEGFHRAAQ